jgi:iron complex outermembrane receptor protein
MKKSYLLIAAICFSFFVGILSSDKALAQREISTGIEEIVVTAQKREENLQDVPASVSAMDAAALEKAFARDLMDVAGVSPNLIIDPVLGNGTAAISIRGMQMSDVEKSFDPAVAVYQDGIYLATSTGALLNVWDADRVEVLRGPQGTMFGRNTIGGLVHVIRSKPTGELGGKINFTISEDDQEDIKALINLPAMLNGTLATKISAMSISGGGYFNNPTRGTSEGDADVEAYSLSALWNPTENLQVHLIYDDINDQSNVRPTTCFNGVADLFPAVGQPRSECNQAISSFHYNTFHSTEMTASVEVEAITLNVEYDINENNKLVVVYGSREMEETSLQEFDNSALDLFRVSRPQTEEQESLELRLETNYSWGKTTVGAFLWESEYDAWQTTWFFGGFNDSPRTLHSTENTAFFAQVDYDLSDKMTLTFGGRWIDEEKSMCQVFTGRDATGTETFYANWPGEEAGVTKTAPDARYAIKSWGACDSSISASAVNEYTDPATGQTKTFAGTESWDDFTPKVGITYDTDNGMVYASYSEGFRSGGFNGRATGANNAGPYDPESVESIEVGFKSIWADNTLQINGAIFSVDYTDKQEDVILPGTDGAVTLTVVQNAAAVSIDGFELETLWVPSPGLTLTANLGILDASYDSYTVLDGVGNNLDNSGLDLRRAPEMTLSLGALYEHALTNGDYLVTSFNYRWKDDYCIAANNKYNTANYSGNNPACNNAFGILDASLSYESENWRLSLYGKNLTDEIYNLYFLDVAAFYSAASPTDSSAVYNAGLWSQGTVNRPKNFGVELEFRF